MIYNVCILFIDLCGCDAPVPEVPEGDFTGNLTIVTFRKITYCVFSLCRSVNCYAVYMKNKQLTLFQVIWLT